MDSRNTDPSLLLSLPKDVKVDVIGQFLNTSAILNLRKTSKIHFYSLFSESRLSVAKRYVLTKLKNLLSHSALSEWEKAEKIWELYPDLLTCPGTVYHPNYIYDESGTAIVGLPFYINPGRYKYVNLTAYQIALVNEEWKEAERMAKYMTVEEQQKQFAEVFPDGKIIKYDWDLKKAKRLLQAVFAEVVKDPAINENDLSKMSESTRKALFALYAYVKPKAEHKIGLIFDANFYVEALKMYQFDKFIRNRDQRLFWCIRVEEWLAGCLGTAYLRPHAQGPWNNLHRRGCILADGSSYFSFRRPIHSIPGYRHFVGEFGDASRCTMGQDDDAVRREFRNLCQATTRAGTDFMRRYLQAEKSACQIC